LIGAPLTAFNSTSVTLVGNDIIGGGATRAGGALLFGAPELGAPGFDATPGADGGLERLSSLELQLEIPNAASSDSTKMVKATRVGVHNVFPVFTLFMGISYSEQSAMKHTTPNSFDVRRCATLLHFWPPPKRNESRMTGACPL
jgi:hypothetical protein